MCLVAKTICHSTVLSHPTPTQKTWAYFVCLPALAEWLYPICFSTVGMVTSHLNTLWPMLQQAFCMPNVTLPLLGGLMGNQKVSRDRKLHSSSYIHIRPLTWSALWLSPSCIHFSVVASHSLQRKMPAWTWRLSWAHWFILPYSTALEVKLLVGCSGAGQGGLHHTVGNVIDGFYSLKSYQLGVLPRTSNPRWGLTAWVRGVPSVQSYFGLQSEF